MATPVPASTADITAEKLSCSSTTRGFCFNFEKIIERRKEGSGKMKAALQCIEWRKKGRSCFHELRWSRHSQEVQCALCRGRARPQAARGSDRGQLGLRFRSIFCQAGRAEQSGGGSVLELGLSPRRARRDRTSGRSGAGPSL